ncbi:amino acid ABC transporter permease [Rhodobacter sp. NTK016B]|uniref:amino acid ABC transporter permease n=1 Tax=Rhodobacter sp. NTK016B TaxID=2759676 RepID=UPI001A90B14C|nr:amino acid ABC transporter permease [Rhodobacter sp. NTK016B]
MTLIEFLSGRYGELLLKGLIVTLQLSGVTLAASFVIGVALTLIRLSPLWIVQQAVGLLVDAIRSVPLLVHVIFWYFGAPELLPDGLRMWLYARDVNFICAAIAISIYAGAFISEDLRSGLRSIPRGQSEASLSLGFSGFETFRYIILPQAFRISVPPLLGQAMTLTKNTSIALMIGVPELVYQARRIQDITYEPLMPYASATLVYVVICAILTLASRAYSRTALAHRTELERTPNTREQSA